VTTSNAGQRREAERAAYNANLADCPGHDLLGTLSDKWVTLVISALADGSVRHAELARVVAGASQKMLTQTLRKLERDGLVERIVTAAVPVRVDYTLTSLDRGLLPVQRAIKAWAEEHIEQVHAARERFDAQGTALLADATSPTGTTSAPSVPPSERN
jgi:DNA-binding HxlR family transcriptional regulator